MIPLPPGCRLVYEIQILVNDLTDDMGEWFNLIGGDARRVQHMDYRGRPKYEKIVQYGKAKASHKMLDGTNNTLIRFAGEDASTASMFILKFMDHVVKHNLKEMEQHE
jgi:hypothetical protein